MRCAPVSTARPTAIAPPTSLAGSVLLLCSLCALALVLRELGGSQGARLSASALLAVGAAVVVLGPDLVVHTQTQGAAETLLRLNPPDEPMAPIPAAAYNIGAALIAEEEGLFSLDDVIQKAGEKMIRRHPHVFSSEAAPEKEEVPGRWEAIKQAEKQGKSAEYEKWKKEAERNASREVIRLLQAES